MGSSCSFASTISIWHCKGLAGSCLGSKRSHISTRILERRSSRSEIRTDTTSRSARFRFRGGPRRSADRCPTAGLLRTGSTSMSQGSARFGISGFRLTVLTTGLVVTTSFCRTSLAPCEYRSHGSGPRHRGVRRRLSRSGPSWSARNPRAAGSWERSSWSGARRAPAPSA